MAASIISSTEDFVRGQFNEAIEEHRHIGPVTKTILDVLMTETASHLGADVLRGSGVPDANRYVVKLVLSTLTERYSMASVTLVLNLGADGALGA